MKLDGRQVLIKCGNRAVPEFDPTVSDDDDGRVIQCWIPAQLGKEFWIEYSCHLKHCPPNTELTADVYFDGVYNGGWIAPDPLPQKKKVTGEIKGSRQGDKLHKFVFSNPKIIEGETPSSVDPDEVGEIWVWLGSAVECDVVEASRAVVPGPPRVNERDKKQGARCAVLKESSEECTEPVFLNEIQRDGSVVFVFKCRSEEWLQAKGIIRKRRRRRGDPEPVEDLDGSPPPKPEPVEEKVPTNIVPTGGAEVAPNTRPSPRSPTPLSYADEEEAAERGEMTHITSQPTAPTLSDFVTLERPQKIPRRSGGFTSTIDRSPTEGSSRPKMKVEEDGLVPKVKVEESSPVQRTKEEAREIKVEAREVKVEAREVKVKVEEFKGLKAEEKELEEQISELERKRANIRGRMAAFRAPRTGSETIPPRDKIKTERGSTRLPFTPDQVIDLTD